MSGLWDLAAEAGRWAPAAIFVAAYFAESTRWAAAAAAVPAPLALAAAARTVEDCAASPAPDGCPGFAADAAIRLGLCAGAFAAGRVLQFVAR